MLGHQNTSYNPTLQIGNVSGGNYLEVDAGGDFQVFGDATQWDDLKVAAQSTKLGGSKDPGFTKILDNGAASQGVFTYAFDATTEEELYFVVQLPHQWLLGSDVKAHVHWVPDGAGGENQVVSWGLEYTWANIGSTFGTTTIISGNAHVPVADTSLVDNRQYLTPLGTISGTGKTLSSMLLCRVFRDAGGALNTDDYPNDAWLLEIDFHFEIDAMGSDQEFTK